MDIAEFKARVEKLMRERQALEGAYADLDERVREAAPPDAGELVPVLLNFIEEERAQLTQTWELLTSALGDLVAVHEPGA